MSGSDTVDPSLRGRLQEMVTLMAWNGGPGWVGGLPLSAGLIASWALSAIGMMTLQPSAHDSQALPRGRVYRGLR